MPTISLFYGILIMMHCESGERHNSPHVHAKYGNYNAVFALDGTLLDGEFPRKQKKLVEAWIVLHEDDLTANWELLQNGEDFFRIEPLR